MTAHEALKKAIAECRREGPVVLSSGKVGDEYWDVRSVLFQRKHLYAACTALYGLMHLGRGTVPLVAGPEGAAGLVGALLAVGFARDGVVVRDEREQHGLGGWAYGHYPLGKDPSRAWSLVDDVATSGATLLHVVRTLREHAPSGRNVDVAAVVLDREEGAKEALAEEGVVLESVFRRSDLDA